MPGAAGGRWRGRLVRIRNSTRQVTQTVASISESILEQGAASNTVAEQVEQVARASEQNNSAIARQSAASACAVAQQAGQTRPRWRVFSSDGQAL